MARSDRRGPEVALSSQGSQPERSGRVGKGEAGDELAESEPAEMGVVREKQRSECSAQSWQVRCGIFTLGP